MSDEPRVTVNFPFALYRTSVREAKIYADLLSTQHDMSFTREFLEESIRRHDEMNVLTQALFSASHMSYRRCFNRGAGGLGKSDLRPLTKEQQEVHSYHTNQADKLIAHSVNGFDIVRVGATVKGETIGVGAITARLTGLDKSDEEKWLALVIHIQEKVLRPKVEQARDIALARIRRIPLKDILRAPMIHEGAPNREGAGRRRD